MDIAGKWFMNPGDMPADYVYPVVLRPDGVAEWLGGKRGNQPYRVTDGTLMIGDGVEELMLFDVRRAGKGWLSGVIRSFVPAEDTDGLEDGDESSTFDDAAVLRRDPGELRVIQDSAETLAAIAADQAARRDRAQEQRGEWGQLGLAIL